MGAKRKKSRDARTSSSLISGLHMRPLLQLLALGVVITGGWFVSTQIGNDVAPIEHVRIEGAFEHLKQQDIRQQLAPVLQQGYFSIDLDDVRKALLSMPWVQDASIRRQWPSGLSIRIEEKHAVAYWGDNELLSDRGELFAPAALDASMALPKLQGPDTRHQKVWHVLVNLQQQLAAIDMQVVRLKLDKRRSWSMKLSNGIELHLGRKQTERRLQRFVSVFSMHNAPDLSTVEYIDLRYPNGFAMHYNKKEANDASASGWSNNA
jgi:cell division protein FtsQ